MVRPPMDYTCSYCNRGHEIIVKSIPPAFFMKIQLPIKNFPRQEEIFSSPARIVAIKKGRRFGFTKGAANNTIKIALSGKKHKGLWVDTVNSNIERYVERFFLPSLRKLPQGMWHWGKQQKVLKIGPSFYMDFRSVDNPENIEGFGYDYMILNEAGIILKDPYLWSNAIRPMMWDSDCQVFIGGTPKGGGGVFEDLYRRGLDPQQPQFAAFYVTSFDNPYIPRAVIEEDMKSMPERVIKQEIYGEFLEESGVVFRSVGEVAILDPRGEDQKQDHLYVIGADLAKLEDFTVLTVYDRSTNCQVLQMRFNQLEWPFIRSKIQEVSRKYNNALVMLDATGVGDPTYDDLARAGVPIEPLKFTNTLKKQLIEKLANWIELKNLKMLRIDETIQELTNFTYDFSEKTDRVYYGAPPGFHDDVVIAHALACWSLQPIIKPRKEPELSTIQRDFLSKVHSYDTGEHDGEFAEYNDTTYY